MPLTEVATLTNKQPSLSKPVRLIGAVEIQDGTFHGDEEPVGRDNGACSHLFSVEKTNFQLKTNLHHVAGVNFSPENQSFGLPPVRNIDHEYVSIPTRCTMVPQQSPNYLSPKNGVAQQLCCMRSLALLNSDAHILCNAS